MKKVTFAIMGMGNRGSNYARKQLKHPDEMQITAIADVKRSRLTAINKILNLPEDRLFSSGEEMIRTPGLADILIIATQDQQHCEHAIEAMKNGYDLLLEKPIAANEEDIRKIVEAAHRYNRRIIICHVLRYTVFYQQIKKLIDSGVIGKVENIDASEMVAYYHYAHSYVRGNWHKLADSSPMILAKSCHDMDILLWLTGKKCKKVSSFGSLDYFTKENCPEGAPKRCSDGCPVKNCPFNAVDFYLSRIPGWPANVLQAEPTEENIMETLRTTDYGRCVWQSDNDVVDHQVVNLLFEDGVTATFSMSAFTSEMNRSIHVMGTKGDITGDINSKKITYCVYGQEPQEIDLTQFCDDFKGHGGGDDRLIYDVIRLYRGDDFDTSAITLIDRSAESHFVAFAAEESRLHDGEVIDMDEYMKRK